MRIPKMCLKQSLSHSKWVAQAILFLTVKLSNCAQNPSLKIPNNYGILKFQSFLNYLFKKKLD